MKKFQVYKSIQLALFALIASISIILLFTDADLYHMAATNGKIILLSGLLWLALAASFLFIYVDFTSYSSLRRTANELDFVVHTDHVAGIANRFSCDAIIEKYLDKPLPSTVGCIMFDLTNIQEINQAFGHIRGNGAIRDFSDILYGASADLCFVGRNGGNKFLAIFEDCSEERMERFLNKVSLGIQDYNKNPENAALFYKYGIAFDENDTVNEITDLISLANRRIG